MDGNYKTIRTLPVDGKKSSWHMWSRRFLVKLTVQGQIGVITGGITIPTDS